jgi:hypothetical protein
MIFRGEPHQTLRVLLGVCRREATLFDAGINDCRGRGQQGQCNQKKQPGPECGETQDTVHGSPSMPADSRQWTA